MKTAAIVLGFLLVVSSALASPPHFKKVVLVVLENTDYNEAIQSKVLGQIANQGALFTNFSGETHPSQGNYIAMVSGTTFGVNHDKPVNLNENHLGDLLEAKSRDWQVYAEDYPGHCFLGTTSQLYVRKHVPFLSFTNVSSNSSRCAKIGGFEYLTSDLEKNYNADFSMIVPNIVNDGHQDGIVKIEAWLKSKMLPILNNAQIMSSTLFIFTFDESDSKPTNRIFTAVVGAGVKPGTKITQALGHNDLLGLIEKEWSLGVLPKQPSPKAIVGLW